MLIRLACKLFNDDARYFLDPLLMSEKVDTVVLYRNSAPEPLGLDIHLKMEGVYHNNKLKFINRLSRMIRDRKADLYVGIYEIPHGIFSLAAAWFNRKPAVVSIIGNPKFEIRNKGFRKYITNRIYKMADVITVTGTESKIYLVSEKSVPAEKIFVLPNSIPMDVFYKQKRQSRFDLITLGRLSPEKGLYKMIDVVELIRDKMPDVKLGIAGKGPMQEELELQIKERGLEDNIEILGYVKDAAEFLNEGKLFITTSFTEGMPRTVIQSMACETPVVATEVGDMKDLVLTGKTGYLIKAEDDAVKIADETYKILSNDTIMNSYAANCHKHIDEHFSHKAGHRAWENMFDYLNCNKS
jgi:glycosyltransferase involved in cell wall biosynthesis